MATKVKEDRSHRSHQLNPRNHPRGRLEYDNPSKRRVWRKLRRFALLNSLEMRYLQDVPRMLGSGDYVNLGHARGASAMLLADGLQEYGYTGTVYSIDLFPKKNDLKKAFYSLRDLGYEKNILLCRGSTIEWAQKLEDKKFKFIFIDADHSYEAVKRDFYDWSFLLEKGGWIAFHDTNQDFSHRAIKDTVAGKWEELKDFHVDRIRTFRKPV